jgi:hypothetical protein
VLAACAAQVTEEKDLSQYQKTALRSECALVFSPNCSNRTTCLTRSIGSVATLTRESVCVSVSE